jgi:hypothetical protein
MSGPTTGAGTITRPALRRAAFDVPGLARCDAPARAMATPELLPDMPGIS